jgi:hypothetical protein
MDLFAIEVRVAPILRVGSECSFVDPTTNLRHGYPKFFSGIMQCYHPSDGADRYHPTGSDTGEPDDRENKNNWV